ncbi:MAG TPA: tetratricopeptide repeat protein [Bacteroidia bacterium]|nr:tetratricopeptide repeat protein [Bacteroidia bacterium]
MADNSIYTNLVSGSSKKRLYNALWFTALFLIVEFIIIQFHEYWADEVHAWAIAHKSNSIADVFYNGRYEGHPKLWYVLLYLLQKFTDNIFYMKVLNLCIATGAVFVFCFFSPFSFKKNILFCSGYFFAYEYSIISRNYAITVLLLFLCAGIFTRYKGKHFLLLSVLFFLLLQTNVYAVIIGIPFYCYIIWILYKDKRLHLRTILISGTIVFAGFILSVLSMKPPSNSGLSTENFRLSLYDSAHTLAVLFNCYVPIPQLNFHFWSSNILNPIPNHAYIQAFLSIVLLIASFVLFKANKKILLLFFSGTVGILLFTYLKYFGYIRHHGHLYLLFILCYWLYSAENQNEAISTQTNTVWNTFSIWIKKYFVTIVLVAQIIATCYANVCDIRYPFSNNLPTVNYLKENSLDKLPILGDGDYIASSVAGLLNKNIYFMRPRYWGQFIVLDDHWGKFIKFSVTDLLNQVDSISDQKKSDVIVVLTYPFNDNSIKNWTLLQTFEGSIIGEDYFIYKVNYVPQNPVKLNTKGEILVSKGYLKEAMSLFEKAIYLKKDYSRAYMNLADCYNNGLYDFNKALQYIDSAVKYNPANSAVLFDKGAILFNKGDKKTALEFFKETIQLDPDLINAYVSAARCYISLSNNDGAISCLKIALKRAPDNSDIYYLLAECYKNKGDILNEKACNNKAQQLKKDI